MSINVRIFLIILITLGLNSCAYFKKDGKESKDENQEKEKLIKKSRPNPDLGERQKKYEGTLFNTSRLKKNNNNFDFSTSNPLWRATLNSLEGVPLQTVSYSGGVIVTDWWTKKGSKESIKIQVNFTSNEVKASSIKISSFKKICDDSNICKIASLPQSFNSKVKDSIFDQAKTIKIEQEENKNK